MNPNIYFDVEALESVAQTFVDNAKILFWWTWKPMAVILIVYLVIGLVRQISRQA